jgi:hypothetical protein
LESSRCQRLLDRVLGWVFLLRGNDRHTNSDSFNDVIWTNDYYRISDSTFTNAGQQRDLKL